LRRQEAAKAMNGKNEVPDDLFEEASIWHARMREPTVSAEDRRAFARWLDLDPRHGQALDEAARLWDALGAPMADLRAGEPVIPLAVARRPALPAPRACPPRIHLSRTRRLRRAALAATVALAAAVGGWLGHGGLDTLRSDLVTAVGQRDTVDLADGSRVVVNTDTALAFDMTAERRRVRLFRGEAFFDVAPDAARPFVVSTSDGDIQVVGTRFNVRVLHDATSVGVMEGQVLVTAPDWGNPMLLAAGQAGWVGPDGTRPLGVLDATAATAWQRGQLVFYRAPLGDVVEELDRYQHGRILILEDGLRSLSVTGVFDATQPTEAIDLIETTLGIRSTRLADWLILLH
jgi:transmembrane sensor